MSESFSILITTFDKLRYQQTQTKLYNKLNQKN